jgi:response regulator RpfG family c-di-GMP phosphodiesterase
MDNKNISILYLDDEPHNLVAFKATFRYKYSVVTAINAAEAVQLLRDTENIINIIITDQRMPETTGVEFLESIIEEFPDPIRILLTGYADLNAVIDAVNKGKIYHYLSKPWKEEELDAAILDAYSTYSKRMEEKEHAKKLAQTADQMEFLLRQSLL